MTTSYSSGLRSRCPLLSVTSTGGAWSRAVLRLFLVRFLLAIVLRADDLVFVGLVAVLGPLDLDVAVQLQVPEQEHRVRLRGLGPAGNLSQRRVRYVRVGVSRHREEHARLDRTELGLLSKLENVPE